MEKETSIFNFIIAVINSCNEKCQLECCLILIDSYFAKFNLHDNKRELSNLYYKKLSELKK